MEALLGSWSVSRQSLRTLCFLFGLSGVLVSGRFFMLRGMLNMWLFVNGSRRLTVLIVLVRINLLVLLLGREVVLRLERRKGLLV